jgi:nucleoside triphosphate pyrophosphatase
VLESFPVTSQPKLILASNSPRRRQLLALAGFDFEVIVSNVDETELPNESPADYVLRLAETKARDIPAQLDQIVLAADTTVVDKNEILGKPADNAEAFAMLTRLRGHTHQVYTGVALLRKSDNLLLKELSITDVPMRNYSDEEINAYIATGDPLDKAGAYAIQHPQFHPVENLTGCFASVMGLPLCHVMRMLREIGWQPKTDVTKQCQTLLEYPCAVSQKVLNGVM